MSFPLYFSKKIAFSKDNRNRLSAIVISIGRLSVALGVMVSLITISIGVASKNLIRERLEDFTGPISVRSTRSNASYNSSVLAKEGLDLNAIKAIPGVSATQKFATVSGILRTKDNFAGIIYKGVGKDFNPERFKKFLVAGTVPVITEKGYNNQVCIPEKIANELHLKPNDSIVAIFSTFDQKPIYRKFEVSGIYKTDVKMIDDLYIIGDINQARKILNMNKDDAGGVDIFLTNINSIEEVYPKVEEKIGIKNYAEKATDKYPQILSWFQIFDNNINVIIRLMMLVVVANIIMVMLIIIIERTNSIGILKTLGATNAQIRGIFINYTLLIMIPGLVTGNLIGLGLLAIQHFFGIIKLNPDNYYISTVPVDFNPLIILSISLVILLISAIALILPSYLISKISPIKSIKYN